MHLVEERARDCPGDSGGGVGRPVEMMDHRRAAKLEPRQIPGRGAAPPRARLPRDGAGYGAEKDEDRRTHQNGVESSALRYAATTFFTPALSKATVSLSPSIAVTTP